MASKIPSVLWIASILAKVSYALSCQDIFIPVSLNVLGKQLPTNLTMANYTKDYLTNVVPGLPNIAITGDYAIGATFCEPSTNNVSRRNTLQLLQHGAAYNRTYWSSLGTGIQEYNYVEFAASQGYPTLAIDRLCNGASSHPSGLLCQVISEADVLHQLVQIARSGNLPISSSRAFNKIILFCFSVGSDICNYNLGEHPSDADGLILSGWSNKLIFGFLSTAFGGIAPASTIYPRYANLDATYLTFGNETGQRYLSYYGDYDTAFAHNDYLWQGTFTIGEAFTALLSQRQTPGYTGPVLLLDGNEDPTYCQTTPISVLSMSVGNCSAGIASGTQDIFPNAAVFSSHVTQNTGHDVNLHNTAPGSYQAVQSFLSSTGF